MVAKKQKRFWYGECKIKKKVRRGVGGVASKKKKSEVPKADAVVGVTMGVTIETENDDLRFVMAPIVETAEDAVPATTGLVGTACRPDFKMSYTRPGFQDGAGLRKRARQWLRAHVV